ncbi:MAG: GNAT family N-acetyltransferase [Deltaproteobacteria bacterium]|nr:GNAT family N-acetyltransferase [Deltaproteobacteria bacterium]MCB9786816.1 GNAT family N-acetyltransferase [Deltaproteobacteria bacterium]
MRLLPWTGHDARGERLEIREAHRRDAARLLEHMAAIVAETEFMLQAAEDPLPEVDEQRVLLDHFARLKGCLQLVAVRPSGGVGRDPVVGSLSLINGQTSRTRHIAHLGMGVRESCWRRGVGSKLLDLALTWARAQPILERVTLQVYRRNAAAHALYRSRGFVDEGELIDEARVGDTLEDLLGMSVDVGQP